jgi:anti-sigma regulatory factor (Ser/Thr protein kinase)
MTEHHSRDNGAQAPDDTLQESATSSESSRRLIPLKIVVIYLLVGGLWILLSDRLLAALVSDPAALSRLQTVKGWFYVLITAILLYGLIVHYLRVIQRAELAARNAALADIAERRKLAEYQREFARKTIEAATGGKLIITDQAEIIGLAGPPIARWEISHTEDLGAIRQAAADIMQAEGMDEDRAFDFTVSLSEIMTNALKHASGGTVSMHHVNNTLFALVADHGPGIAVLNLPEVALRQGYTTAISLGMGYKALLAIADRVYLATSPDGTTVGVQMALQAPKHPAAFPIITDAEEW